jgi:topoisomerase-4 subunit B
VVIGREANIQEMLGFFMGKNTPDRQKFIIENLRVDKDEPDDDADDDADEDVEGDVVDDVEEALEV